MRISKPKQKKYRSSEERKKGRTKPNGFGGRTLRHVVNPPGTKLLRKFMQGRGGR